MEAATALRTVLPLIAVGVLGLAGCGGSVPTSKEYRPPKAGRAAASATLFPPASGKSLEQVLKSTDGPLRKLGLVAEPTAMVFYKGRNRYPIEITTRDKLPVDDVEIALYVAKAPAAERGKRKAQKDKGPALQTPARGPFPAGVTTLATSSPFAATSTIDDPRSATVVFVANLDFPANGEWRVGAVVRDGNDTFSTLLPNVNVGEFDHVPKLGQRAPLIHTPTAASVGGDLAAISTRRPPSTMNQVDFASVLGRKPVLLLFASPKFSWNGTAGPTVDVAEQVRRRFKGRAVFINVEIYNDNDPAKFTRPQVRAFHLPTEPWLFAIDRQGRVVGEAEGAIGVTELTALADRAVEGQVGPP